jgi:hypothetical protein
VQIGSKNDLEKLLLPSVPFKNCPIESSHGGSSLPIRNFNQVYFIFREDLEEIESNLNTVSSIVDILRYSRNYKIHPFETE